MSLMRRIPSRAPSSEDGTEAFTSRPPTHRPMEQGVQGGGLRPSVGLASILTFLGIWLITLGVIDIIWGAVDNGLHANFRGMITMGTLGESGEYLREADRLGQALMIGIGSGLTLIGVISIRSQFNGGFVGWVRSMLFNPLWASLLSIDEERGAIGMLAAWLIIGGLSFQIVWNLLNWTWVDPGVYAVSAPMILFGCALAAFASTEHDEESGKGASV